MLPRNRTPRRTHPARDYLSDTASDFSFDSFGYDFALCFDGVAGGCRHAGCGGAPPRRARSRSG